jgi:hypothetical protein
LYSSQYLVSNLKKALKKPVSEFFNLRIRY